ncbi:MAG: hypothetical protein LBO73_03100 [Holosporaceae bacterium]|jgi:hypothetical protein|nr:hypothetical protein [Holosporaceae bacterium]
MYGFGQTGLQCLIFAFLAAATFFSANFGNGLMYCFIFISNGSGIKYVNLSSVFLISLFSDICSLGVVGVTFAPAAMFYMLSYKIKTIFQNFADDFLHLLPLLLYCRAFHFLLVKLNGRDFNVSSNCKQVTWTLFLYAAFCIWRTFRSKEIVRV